MNEADKQDVCIFQIFKILYNQQLKFWFLVWVIS